MQPAAPHEPGWEPARNAPGTPQGQPVAEPHLLLGRYRIVETRATGGFGTVQVCWDIRLQRRVAIKCMPLATGPNTTAATLQEALDEARITSRLAHPNIVTVHDFELAGTTAYLIMEYVDGLTLAELLARVEGGVLTYDECAHLLGCLANALAYAHENGVLHLDIKPSNVFIDGAGTIKLGDFGMASLASAAGWEGARGGTVGYMPPEQLRCELVDERTDVFALAVVCYQALTGISPFAAPDAERSLKLIEKHAKPLGKIEAELAGPVTEGIARALEADPGMRPGSTGEFCDSVLPFLGDEREGKRSLADIMAQTTGECGPNEQAWQQAAHVSALERWPWLPQALLRSSGALAAGALAARVATPFASAVAQHMGIDSTAQLAVGIALVCAGAGALSPAAGALLAAGLLLATTALAGAHSASFLVTILGSFALVAWRRGVAQGAGRGSSRRHLASIALAAPCALAAPSAGAAIAAATLAPAQAAATAALGVALETTCHAVSAGSTGGELAQALASSLLSTHTLALAAGAGIAAAAGAVAGARRGTTGRVAAQGLTATLLVAVQVALVRVENAGIWSSTEAANVAVALVCLVLMSIAIVTLGSTPKPREDE